MCTNRRRKPGPRKRTFAGTTTSSRLPFQTTDVLNSCSGLAGVCEFVYSSTMAASRMQHHVLFLVANSGLYRFSDIDSEDTAKAFLSIRARKKPRGKDRITPPGKRHVLPKQPTPVFLFFSVVLLTIGIFTSVKG